MSRDSEGKSSVDYAITAPRGWSSTMCSCRPFEDGVIPSAYGDPDEERRLAYVALTRGKPARHDLVGPVSARAEEPCAVHRGHPG